MEWSDGHLDAGLGCALLLLAVSGGFFVASLLVLLYFGAAKAIGG